MEWNIAHQKLGGIGTEFNFKNYPVRNILIFLYVTECSQKHVQKIQLTIQTFAHYNWNLHCHYFAEKIAVQKEFLYVAEYSQKHPQKIQLTKQQKAIIEQPPSQKFKSFSKARATPPGLTFYLKRPI